MFSAGLITSSLHGIIDQRSGVFVPHIRSFPGTSNLQHARDPLGRTTGRTINFTGPFFGSGCSLRDVRERVTIPIGAALVILKILENVAYRCHEFLCIEALVLLMAGDV
jgi:hypothetical protein